MKRAPAAVCMAAGAALAAAGLSGKAAADQGGRHGVSFNERYIESLTASPDLEIGDVDAVFSHVFAALPHEVKVYPTENYYYFSFGHGGLIFAGNFRLDVKDRDDGIVHFAYFNQHEDWNTDIASHYKAMGAADGVRVEKLETFAYRLTHKGRSVLFRLNDLSSLVPPEEKLGPGDEYLGPVFDESGVQFYFLLNRTRKKFFFVLNENGPPADFLQPYGEEDPAILLGARTGFAFYRDRFLDRRILVGVYAGNVATNNYFDGPFDQLPDNFFRPGQFLDAILTVYPDLQGKVDEFGAFKDHDGRVLVTPYMNYSYLNELEELRRCANEQMAQDAFYLCLLPPEEN